MSWRRLSDQLASCALRSCAESASSLFWRRARSTRCAISPTLWSSRADPPLKNIRRHGIAWNNRARRHDHDTGKPVPGARGFGRGGAGEPCREIAGIEGIAGRRGVDRLHDARRRYLHAIAASEDEATMPAALDHNLLDPRSAQAGDAGSRVRIAE